MSRRPRLRPEIVVRRFQTREDAYVIVKDPDGPKYYKFEDWEYDLLTLLDGTRDLEEIASALQARRPGTSADLRVVVDCIEGLRQLDLLERTEQERHLVMMEKATALRRRRFYDAEHSTLFQIQIPFFDPDRLMNRIIPLIRWWWSPWFVGVWLLIFAILLGFLIRHWDLYWAGLFGLWNLPQKTFWDWIAFLLLIFAVSLWHELGHGLTCKRYGGEVHDIGFMIFYLQPAFYCAVDDSYLFPSRAHRIYASFGGAYFELMLCSVATTFWLLTPAEWLIHGVALSVVFFTGLSVIVLNVNPLIRLDGYYVLMDLLDVPNLREDSFAYLGNLLKKHLLRLEVPAQPISRRRRRIYLIYGLFSVTYTATLMVLIYTFLRRWLVGSIGPAGYLALFGAIGLALRRRIAGLVRFVHHLWLDKRELLSSPPGRAAGGLALLATVFLLLVPRCATRIESPFAVEPGARAVVRAPVDGTVRSLAVVEGARVAPGEALAILDSADLTSGRAVAASDRARAEREAAEARLRADIPAERERLQEAREAETRVQVADEKIGRLALTAPLAGVVSTAHLEDQLGRYLRQGETFCAVDRLDTVRLAVAASERDIEEIRPGTPVRILVTSYPGRTLRSSVVSLAPVAHTPVATGEQPLDLVRRANLVRVLVEVGNAGGLLRPGMTGRVQFLTHSRSVAGQAWWRLRRWAASFLW